MLRRCRVSWSETRRRNAQRDAAVDRFDDLRKRIDGERPESSLRAVLVDSGLRRGTDICKALCMGATAVGVGRPYIGGLGAFGQAGVERVLELRRAELMGIMQQV